MWGFGGQSEALVAFERDVASLAIITFTGATAATSGSTCKLGTMQQKVFLKSARTCCSMKFEPTAGNTIKHTAIEYGFKRTLLFSHVNRAQEYTDCTALAATVSHSLEIFQ